MNIYDILIVANTAPAIAAARAAVDAHTLDDTPRPNLGATLALWCLPKAQLRDSERAALVSASVQVIEYDLDAPSTAWHAQVLPNPPGWVEPSNDV